MSATIKPEIYISWIPTGKINLKPEIYASWIPIGKINLKPQIFASYIPAPEKVSADLFRKVSASESSHADLSRQIKNAENISADLLRNVVDTEKISADTKRKLFAEENISGDTFRQVVHAGGVHADTYREVKRTEKTFADTSRKIGVTTTRADLQRIIKSTEKSISDLCRKIGGSEKISADLLLRIVNGETAEADTFRQVKDSCTARADTLIKNGVKEKISAQTKRAIANHEKILADTFLQIAATEKFYADLLRGLRDVARADSLRKVVRSAKTIADTVIRIPHILKYVVQNKPKLLSKKFKSSPSDETKSLVNTFKDYGVTAINITLSEKTLSDDFTFDIAVDMEINEAVEGWLLDYPFKFLVEEVSQTDIIRTVKGMYNQDKLLYAQFFLPTYTDEKDNEHVVLCTAWDYMHNVANALHLKADVHIEDFTPYNLSGNNRITYADLLYSLFNWTTRLPQRQVNVFIRGDTLYCIQRGHEPNTFDITELSHSRPKITKRLIRSLWSNPKPEKNKSTSADGDDDESKDTSDYKDDAGDNDPIVDYLWEEKRIPFSGTIEFEDDDCYSMLKYTNGLLRREKHVTSAATRSTSIVVRYNYIEVFHAEESEIEIFMQKIVGDFYLAYKSSSITTVKLDDDGTWTKTIQDGSVSYHYEPTRGGDIYLHKETDITVTTECELTEKGWVVVDEDKNTRETYHVPLGNGWYGQSVYVNGVAQGSNISQGKPGNKVSQYMCDEVQLVLKGYTVTYEIKNNDSSDISEDKEFDPDNPDNPYNPDNPDNPDPDNPDETPEDGDKDPRTEEEKYEDWRRKLAPTADISFPVRELNLIVRLTNDLLWLNRKTEETVTLDLISKVVDGVPEINHIVDFTERIIFNGAEYFLVSNNISFTPRKLIQKLQLIRWY